MNSPVDPGARQALKKKPPERTPEVEEEKKHKSSEVEVSDNVSDAAAESRLIQQRKSGGNNKQEFPAMENKGPDGGEPGVPRKEIEKKNNDKWTPKECVIAPVFEKTNSLTEGLLKVNDDSILRKVDQDDSRPARKTAYEKKKSARVASQSRGTHSPTQCPSQTRTGSHPRGPSSRSPTTKSSREELGKVLFVIQIHLSTAVRSGHTMPSSKERPLIFSIGINLKISATVSKEQAP